MWYSVRELSLALPPIPVYIIHSKRYASTGKASVPQCRDSTCQTLFNPSKNLASPQLSYSLFQRFSMKALLSTFMSCFENVLSPGY